MTDIIYFSRWWRDKELAQLTSGHMAAKKDIPRYFSLLINSKNDLHYMIVAGNRTIGHLALRRRRNDWYETQIVIGERQFRGKGLGTRAIKQLLVKAKRLKIKKIFLLVRTSNLRAISAYQKAGFRTTKNLRDHFRMELKN